ncbi:MAG TPA: hypothetical protein VFV99_17285 [Kofleriaceae bacterium]|nr:hypothetical protein [Kofleriaceae bacterium]
MKATVVGATVPAKTLRAALLKADVPTKDVRMIGPRAWVELPHDGRDASLARLAEALATGLMVIDVDLPAPSGEGLQASRATYRGVEADISEEARKLLDERRADPAAKPLDDAVAASHLAWALVGDADDTASPAEPNVEEQWATSLIGKLVADGLIELRGTHTPIAQLAQVLQTPGRDLGERLLASLIDSTAIDEVYADADQLATLARATRPKR